MSKHRSDTSKINKDIVSTSPASEVEEPLATVDRTIPNVTSNDYSLQPVVIYLHSHFSFEGSGGSFAFINILSMIAVLILLIACFNFMNLKTARSATRSIEVGLYESNGGF